jgi:hypothetical protein
MATFDEMNICSEVSSRRAKVLKLGSWLVTCAVQVIGWTRALVSSAGASVFVSMFMFMFVSFGC